MQLKNFIEINKGAFFPQLGIAKPNGFKKSIHIDNISKFEDCTIMLNDGEEVHCVETHEQIQQKIFECQNIDNYDKYGYTPIYDCKNNDFVDYINK